LLWREDLLEQGPRLNLTPGPAGLDVAQHPLEVTDSGGERLHLAESAVDQLEPITDQSERFAESLVQGSLKLFVDGLAHQVELLAIVFLECPEPCIYAQAKFVEFLLVGVRESGEALSEPVQLTLLKGGQFRYSSQDGVVQIPEGVAQLRPRLSGVLGGLQAGLIQAPLVGLGQFIPVSREPLDFGIQSGGEVGHLRSEGIGEILQGPAQSPAASSSRSSRILLSPGPGCGRCSPEQGAVSCPQSREERPVASYWHHPGSAGSLSRS
jgi:hypothetical protein